MKMNKKLIVATAACAALLVGSISTSLAWLVDTSGNVTNTFTHSDINVELNENTGSDYKMIPGHTIPKDPEVTIATGSEPCYVFVEITETGAGTYDLDDFISYTVDGTYWKKLDTVTDRIVYYGATVAVDGLTPITVGTPVNILENDQVIVKQTVTKQMMDAIDGVDAMGIANSETQPKLSFIAYASQYWMSADQAFNVDQAWANIATPTQEYTNTNP